MKKLTAFLTALILFLQMAGSAGALAESGRIRNFEEFESQAKSYTDVCAESFRLDVSYPFAMQIPKEQERLRDTVRQNGIIRCSFELCETGPLIRLTLRAEYYPGKRCAYAFASGDTNMLNGEEKELLGRALEIVSPMNGSDEEIVKQIHDYICKNVSPCDGASETRTDGCNTAAGALLSGMAQPDGYADAFCLLCSLKGIEAMYVPGKIKANGNGSAEGTEEFGEYFWNAVKLDGQWYMLDVAGADGERAVNYLFYLLGTDMMSADFSWSAVFPEKMSREAYARTENPFIPVNSWDEAGEKIMEALRQGSGRLCLTGLDFQAGREKLTSIVRKLVRMSDLDIGYFMANDRCEIVFKP